MARLNTVKSFRGTSKTEDGNLTCGSCREKITPGDSYRWWANRLPGQRGSFRNIRCSKPECTPTTADMTPGRAGQLMQIQQDGSTQIWEAGLEDLQGIAESLAEEVRSMAEELAESAQNIEDGFGHETSQSAELAERAENMEGYADELESVDIEDEFNEEEPEFDADVAKQEILGDDFGGRHIDSLDLDEVDDLQELLREKRETFENEHAEWEQLKEQHLEEQRQAVQDALDAVDVY